jgi:plasmid stability protein
LTIADIDDDLHYELKVRAHDAGLTLRDFVIEILSQKVAAGATNGRCEEASIEASNGGLDCDTEVAAA